MDFQSPIKHNLATHAGSENLVIRVTTSEGVTGYGEGIPRTFVTGEVLSGSLAFIQEVLVPELLARKFQSPQGLLIALEDLSRQTGTRRFPGAFCALETALLDAAGRTWKVPVHELIGPKQRTSVVYSAVITMMSPEQMHQIFHLVKMRHMQFVKLKVGTDSDLETLSLVRDQLGFDVDIRVDANSAWSPSETRSCGT